MSAMKKEYMHKKSQPFFYLKEKQSKYQYYYAHFKKQDQNYLQLA